MLAKQLTAMMTNNDLFNIKNLSPTNLTDSSLLLHNSSTVQSETHGKSNGCKRKKGAQTAPFFHFF